MCVLFSKWSDGLDILVLGVPSLVSHWKRTMSLQQWRCWLYTRKCLHFCLLPALFLYAVLVFKWSDGLDIFSGFLGKSLGMPPPPWKEPWFFLPFRPVCLWYDGHDVFWSFFFVQWTWWTFSDPLFQLNVGHGEPCCSLPFLPCAYGVMVQNTRCQYVFPVSSVFVLFSCAGIDKSYN